MPRLSAFNLLAILLGIAFLYLPIVVLVIYSFNASQLVAVWGGWSIHWYGALIDDAPLLDSAAISIRLAVVSASAATMLGTLAAVALTRFGRLRGVIYRWSIKRSETTIADNAKPLLNCELRQATKL